MRDKQCSKFVGCCLMWNLECGGSVNQGQHLKYNYKAEVFLIIREIETLHLPVLTG